jgi:excisionase family DNA binding protein
VPAIVLQRDPMTKHSLSSNEAGVPDSGCYVNKAQVAKWLGVTVRTVDSFMKRGLLVYYRIGRTVRFKLEDVDAHLRKSCRVAGRGTASFTDAPNSYLDGKMEFRRGSTQDQAKTKEWISLLMAKALNLG